MKILKFSICSCILALATNLSIADGLATKTIQEKEQPLTNYVIPEFDYSYFDFKFNSVSGANFQHYDGYSNQYRVGGDVFLSQYNAFAGLNLYRVDTHLTSNSFIAPFSPSRQKQDIQNNLMYFHLTKLIESVGIDVGGAFGRFKLNELLVLSPNTAQEMVGYGKNDNNNWYVTVAALYNQKFGKVYLNGQIRYLHGFSQVHAFDVQFNSPSVLPLTIPRLDNRTNWTIEHIKAGYSLNDWLTPFATVGLVQVIDVTNNRPLVSGPFIGGLPQLNVDRNGYTVGGGIDFQRNQFILTVQETYYRAASIYHSTQTMVRLAYVWN